MNPCRNVGIIFLDNYPMVGRFHICCCTTAGNVYTKTMKIKKKKNLSSANGIEVNYKIKLRKIRLCSVRYYIAFGNWLPCFNLVVISNRQLPTNSKPQIKQVFDDVHFIFMRKCGEMKWPQHFCTQFASFGN